MGPQEIPTGEEFTIAVVCKPVAREQSRMVAIQFPESWKIVRGYAAEDGATESTPLYQYPELASYFEKSKGHAIKIFEDRTSVYAENYSGIIYFFTFIAPSSSSTGEFKVCIVERSDPGIPEKKSTKKGKKNKPAKIKNYDWRVISPELGSTFAFAEINDATFLHSTHFVTGWKNTSRALTFSDSINATARLVLPPDVLQQFISGPFTISWWMKAPSGETMIHRFLHRDSASGFSISLNPLGQIAIAKYPVVDADSDILLISSGLVTDGAWHHIGISKDSDSVVRIFIDGEFTDSAKITRDIFHDIHYSSIGSTKSKAHISIDELIFSRRLFVETKSSSNENLISVRDTLPNALAIFHFEDFGNEAHSSIGVFTKANDSTSPSHYVPIFYSLDSGLQISESSSPVLFDHTVLSVEQTAPTRITFSWKTTGEVGIRRYELQRRIATYGEYEKTLSVPAKHLILGEEDPPSIIARASYSAAEKLPSLTHDIDLYYRLSAIGNNDSVLYSTEPVKLEFGGTRDIFVEQNKPNPFNPKTTISFRLLKTGNVNVTVFDIIGREVVTLHDGKLSAGKHSIDIEATTWPGGIYFYKVKTAKAIVTKKMVLAK